MNQPREIDYFDLFDLISDGQKHFLKISLGSSSKYFICSNGLIRAEVRERGKGNFHQALFHQSLDKVQVISFDEFLHLCGPEFGEEVAWFLFHLKKLT